MQVFFSNLSSGGVSPLTCDWDFDNDGSIDATEWEPSHGYSTSGTYTVSLSVTDARGKTDTEVKSDWLAILLPGGGTVQSGDGQITLELPSGAVAGTAIVTIDRILASLLPDPPKGFMMGDTCFVIVALDESGNDIGALSQPSTITVKYSEEDVVAAGDPENLVLAYWDEAAGEWKTLETLVDTANTTLSASTTHVGTWAVLGRRATDSGWLPTWVWAIFGIGAIGVLGALVYLALVMKPAKPQDTETVR